MSISEGVGAAAAAGEILERIKTLQQKYIHNPEVQLVLQELQGLAVGIKQSGEAGWY